MITHRLQLSCHQTKQEMVMELKLINFIGKKRGPEWKESKPSEGERKHEKFMEKIRLFCYL